MTIEFRNVRAAYGDGENVLEDVSFSIGKGEFVAFVGPNGSGKSLVMRLVRGLERPSAGQVIIDGMPTTSFKAGQLARRVGYLFQNPDEQMCADTVHDEIYFGLRVVGGFGTYVDENGDPVDADDVQANEGPADASEADEHDGEPTELRLDPSLRTANRVDALIEQFGLDSEANPLAISQGARKLVALASILVLDAPIVVLDDPTAGLDFRECVKAFEAIRAMRKNGTTVLMTCHDMEVVADFAERVIAMDEGRIIDDGPTFEVLRNLHTLEVAKLIPPQIIDVSLALEYMRPELAGYPITRANTLNEMQSAIEASCGSPRIPGILGANSGYSTQFGAPGAQELENGSIDSYLAKLDTVQDGPGGGLAPRARLLSQARHFNGVTSFEVEELEDLDESAENAWPDDVWAGSMWAGDDWDGYVENINVLAESGKPEEPGKEDASAEADERDGQVDSEETGEADLSENSEVGDADDDSLEEPPTVSDDSEDVEAIDDPEGEGEDRVSGSKEESAADDSEGEGEADTPEDEGEDAATPEDAETPETPDDSEVTGVSEGAEELQDGGSDD